MKNNDLEYIKAYIYTKLGRPKNPRHEKLKIYKEWTTGGLTRGRFSCITDDGIYSCFLVENDGQLSVFKDKKVGEEPDLVIQLRKPAKV